VLLVAENFSLNLFYTFDPQSTWYVEVKVELTAFDYIYVISFKQFHKEEINNKI